MIEQASMRSCSDFRFSADLGKLPGVEQSLIVSFAKCKFFTELYILAYASALYIIKMNTNIICNIIEHFLEDSQQRFRYYTEANDKTINPNNHSRHSEISAVGYWMQITQVPFKGQQTRCHKRNYKWYARYRIETSKNSAIQFASYIIDI